MELVSCNSEQTSIMCDDTPELKDTPDLHDRDIKSYKNASPRIPDNTDCMKHGIGD